MVEEEEEDDEEEEEPEVCTHTPHTLSPLICVCDAPTLFCASFSHSFLLFFFWKVETNQ